MMAPAFAQPLPHCHRLLAKGQHPDRNHAGPALNIRSIPTLVLFVNGQEVQRQAGVMDAASIQRWLAAGLRQAGK